MPMHELTDLQFEISKGPESCSAYGRPPKANDGVGKGGDQIELYSPVSNPVTEHTGFGNFLGASCSWRGDENQTVRTIWAACCYPPSGRQLQPYRKFSFSK